MQVLQYCQAQMYYTMMCLHRTGNNWFDITRVRQWFVAGSHLISAALYIVIKQRVHFGRNKLGLHWLSLQRGRMYYPVNPS